MASSPGQRGICSRPPVLLGAIFVLLFVCAVLMKISTERGKEIAELDSLLLESQQAIDSTNRERDLAQLSHKEAETELEKLRNSKKSLDNEKNKLKNELDSVKAELETCKEESESARTEKEGLQQTLNQERQKMEEKISQLTQQNDQLTQENDQLTQQKLDLTEENQGLRQQVEKLSTEKPASTSTIPTITNDNAIDDMAENV